MRSDKFRLSQCPQMCVCVWCVWGGLYIVHECELCFGIGLETKNQKKRKKLVIVKPRQHKVGDSENADDTNVFCASLDGCKGVGQSIVGC